ncbi:PA14 domain-containing protein [Spirosoma validum]|uniref:OmpA family protein n=1 Tax=Spirosoma validum TaxID=2771355 RepID=A0A927GH85_9BACT|nr:PA14 domain-containing protein [Spirosoma validum]MBD2757478.1 OmpA family protein [Spirosoma validum]
MPFNRLCLLTASLSGVLLSFPLWAQQGLTGEYYRGTDFAQKVHVRIDPTLDFDWSTRPPLPDLDWSYYSIRWTGGLRAPVSGQYTFYCGVDDGIRLWVGKHLVIDEWHLTPYRHYEGQIHLVAGRTYPIRIDYFNDIHGGRIDLRWERPDQPDRWFGWLSDPGETIPTVYLHPPSRPNRPRQPAVTPDIPLVLLAKKALPVKPKREPTAQTWITRSQPRPVDDAPPLIIRPVTGPPPVVAPLSLLFAPGSYELTPASRQQLDSVLVYWKKNPPGRIEVVGHADRLGDRGLNKTLSEYRARVVMAYLTRQGIAPTQLRGRWHGDEQPLTLDAMPTRRARNRRTLILSHYD